MSISNLNRLIVTVVISTALAAVSSPSCAQAQPKDSDQREGKEAQGERKTGQQQKEERERQAIQRQQAVKQEQTAEQRRALTPQAGRQQALPAQLAQQHAVEQKAVRQRTDRSQAARTQAAQQPLATPQNRAVAQANNPARNSRVKPQGHQRLPSQQQQANIIQQQRRVVLYRQVLVQRQAASRQNTQQLQQQKRVAQYGYQQQYYQRMRQQQLGFLNDRHDYANDPYFYTASNFRYNRGGSFYETNQYGAALLRQALNHGYQEGFHAGRADQQDHWRYSYRESFAYQDANYGYDGYYVQQEDYNYYFREGFQRGYEDGYYSRRKYGSNSNGSDFLLGAVLAAILNLQSLR